MVDASAISEYLLDSEVGKQFRSVLEDPEAELSVPAMCDVELCNAIRKLIRRGVVDVTRAAEMLEDYLDLPLERHDHPPLLGRIVELRDNFSAYDATYVALAEQLEATLVTSDQRLTRAVRDHLELNVVGVS